MLYIHHNGGGLASMAIDVDGKRPKGDNPQDSQDGTAFEGILKRYNISGVTDLDPYIHPYVVFGNQGTKKGYTTFHPRMYDIQPLSVMAVVCADKLVRAGLETEVLLPFNLLTRNAQIDLRDLGRHQRRRRLALHRQRRRSLASRGIRVLRQRRQCQLRARSRRRAVPRLQRHGGRPWAPRGSMGRHFLRRV